MGFVIYLFDQVTRDKMSRGLKSPTTLANFSCMYLYLIAVFVVFFGIIQSHPLLRRPAAANPYVNGARGGPGTSQPSTTTNGNNGPDGNNDMSNMPGSNNSTSPDINGSTPSAT